MGRPGYEMAAGDGRGRLRASHADRERVIDTLKAAAAGHNRRSPASLPASAVVQLNVLRPS
jgi:hypothetical protein